MLFKQIMIASVMVLATTAIHGAATFLVIKRLVAQRRRQQALGSHPRRRWSHVRKAGLVSSVAMTMFLASLIEIGIWAVLYLQIGVLGDVRTAAYFSAVTFSAVGYGDVTLHEPWRLLSALEGANGVILFGWSTSLVFGAVREVVVQPEHRS
jgi:hypothetical protein